MKKQIQNVVIIGATSAIAQGIARLYAQRGVNFFLVARNQDHVSSVANDLVSRGAGKAHVFVADMRMRDAHADIVDASISFLGRIDVVLIAHGVLGDQRILDHDVDATIDNFMVNAVSVISISHRYADVLEKQGSGTLVGLSSVAGERGRRSVYTYGASKAAVTAFFSGLRSRLAVSGVRVLTVKPGVVDTPMTQGRTQPFKASVEVVARDIVSAVDKGKRVLYTPGFWSLIMAVVRALPEALFMKVKF